MTFLELAKMRSSVRKYQSKAVEPDKINMILEVARVSPTAGNKQPNHFLVLTDSQDIEKLNKGTNSHGAPLAIIICADKSTAWVRPFDKASMAEIDATVATDHMMMCVEDLGLGSCWLTYFDPVVIRKEFNIPDNIVPINILAIGYPEGETASPSRHSTERKPLSDMVHYKSF